MSLQIDHPRVVSARPGLDGVAILTAYAVLLIALPSRLVVGPLGGAGTPASLFGLGCALWWLWDAARRDSLLDTPRHPVRIATGVFVAAVIMSYVIAMRRPINAAETSTATLGLLSVAGWMGSLLVAHDGISELDRLRTIVKRLVTLGGLLGALGLVQFVTGLSIVDAIRIPGLVDNIARPLGIAERNGFNRPSGTAIHAIEFSVVITMLLPLGLVMARVKDGRNAFQRWWPVAAMAAAVPIAISRSAIVGAVIGMIVFLPVLPKLERRLVVVGALGATVGTFLLAPGLLGSMINLFTGISADGSTQSRTNSYGIVAEYFVRHPFFGRGFSTFLPSHRILDNQYLGILMDIGLVGLLAFLGLLLTAIFAGFRVRRATTDIHLRELGQALAASVVVGAVGFALFDGLSFPMTAGLLFLVIGLCGALRQSALALPASAGSATVSQVTNR